MEKAVVFDMDGVIFDTEHMIWKAWIKVADSHQMENIGDVLRRCLGVNLQGTKEIFLKQYGPDFDFDGFRKEADTLLQKRIEKEGIPVKKGAYNLLAYLKENGYKIALASSTQTEKVIDELKQADLYQYFEVIVGGDQVTCSKPDPEIYLTACQKIGVNPKEAYAIEDSFNGIRSAAAAGLKAIMVPDILQPNATILPLVHKVFESLNDVKVFLEGTFV